MGIGIHSSLSSSNRCLINISERCKKPEYMLHTPQTQSRSALSRGTPPPRSPCTRMGSWQACLRRMSLSMGRCMCPNHLSANSSKVIDSTYPVLMPIFATQHSLSSRVRIIISRRRDIDEQSTRGINPSRINDIHPISLVASDVMRVDLQHVISAFWYSRSLVVEDSHVVIRGEVVH